MMQIETIVLYSHDGRQRRLDLRLGALNVISGDSQTGKSALLEIIDYCFGSAQLRVPEGVISERVAWYALMLRVGDERIFVARPAPRPGAQSSRAAMLRVAAPEALPSAADLGVNTNTDGLEEYLTRRAGIADNLHEPDPGSTRPALSANISHALFLCLQAQDEIANRRLLFHRQSEDFIPQAIRDTLPYCISLGPSSPRRSPFAATCASASASCAWHADASPSSRQIATTAWNACEACLRRPSKPSWRLQAATSQRRLSRRSRCSRRP